MNNYVVITCSLIMLTACSRAPEAPVGSVSSVAIPTAEYLPETTFTVNNFGNLDGNFYVEGFGNVVQVTDPACETDCTEQDYVYFTVTEVNNTDFMEFVNATVADPFGSEQAIGLGCLESGSIVYENDSDRLERQEFSVPASSVSAILAASAQEPVTLHLQALPLQGNSELPVCYSKFITKALW